MSDQYQHPDDPEVFARVLEDFRNTPVAYWEAQIALHAREARALAKATKSASADNIQPKNRKRKPTGETNGSVGS